MANPPRHFMAKTSCVIKSSPKEWDYEKDTINSLNSHPQLRSIGLTLMLVLGCLFGCGDNAGSTNITLNVKPPDYTPPKMTKTNFTVKDADPLVLLRDGVIIEFDETIAKSSLKLTYEDDGDLGWLLEVKDNKVKLIPLKGKGDFCGPFIVQGAVTDVAGNTTDIKLTFVTKECPE